MHPSEMNASRHPDLGGSLSQAAIGAAIAVHRQFGPGLEEADYEEALHRELFARGIEHDRQVPLPLIYKGITLDCGYRMDMVIDGSLLLELKALEKLHPLHEAQLLTYLRLSKIVLGLLVNFKVLSLRDGIKRLACSVVPAPRVYLESPPTGRFDELSREVIAAALEVQHHLGTGLLRSAYEACLTQELRMRGVKVEINLPANFIYREESLPSRKLIPMVVENKLMVACHCVKELGQLQLACDRSLLKATKAEFGLCLNFHSESLATEIRRIRSHAA